MKTTVSLIISFLAFTHLGYAAESVDYNKFGPHLFTNDAFGAPSEDPNTVEYIIWKLGFNKKELSEEVGKTFTEKKQMRARIVVEDLKRRGLLKSPPFAPKDLKAALEGKHPETPKTSKSPSTKKEETQKSPFTIAGIWKEAKETEKWKVGPIRLREKVEEWNKSLSDSSSALFSFTRDNITGNDSWTGKGALIYPIDVQGAQDLHVLPSVSWNLQDVSGGSESDVEELLFQVPFDWELLGKTGDLITQNSWRLQLAPTYLTDLEFDGAIAGTKLTLSPHIEIGNIEIGSYRSLTRNKKLAYMISITPRFQYNKVLETSPFISREDNDEVLALGADWGISLKPFGKKSIWEIGAAYSHLNSFIGEESAIEMITLSSRWQMVEHLSLTIQYQDGTTPIAEKDIDQVIAGIGMKF